VFDLHEVAGVEETSALKPGGANALGVVVQATCLLQPFGFAVARGQDDLESCVCVMKYMPPWRQCKVVYVGSRGLKCEVCGCSCTKRRCPTTQQRHLLSYTCGVIC